MAIVHGSTVTYESPLHERVDCRVPLLPVALVPEELHEHPVVPHVVVGQLGRPVRPVGVLGLHRVVAQVDRLVARGEGERTGAESAGNMAENEDMTNF